jgi:glutamine amidotransferase
MDCRGIQGRRFLVRAAEKSVDFCSIRRSWVRGSLTGITVHFGGSSWFLSLPRIVWIGGSEDDSEQWRICWELAFLGQSGFIMNVVIVDYKMGNIGSIVNILKKVGVQAKVSSDPEIIYSADKLVLPGVGRFDQGITNLNELGLVSTLNEKVLSRGTPILGICLGMQLLTRRSEEGNLDGLGWLPAETVRFNFSDQESELKVPHMGWNIIRVENSRIQAKIFDGMDDDRRFYFVHSYYVRAAENEIILSRTNYGHEFVSGICQDNIIGVQFHPEKSHRYGLKLFENFLST